MHRFTPDGRWTAPPGQFAARIAAGNLPGVLSKSLLVDLGIRAILLEEGEIAGELGPGLHTLDSLADRLLLEPRRHTAVVVLRDEEIAIEIAETPLSTQDGQTARVGLRARVRVDNATLFLENVLGSRDSLAFGELQSKLAPVLAEQLRRVAGRTTLENLMSADASRRLTDAMSEADAGLRHLGFRLESVTDVSISQQEQADHPASAPGGTAESRPPDEPSVSMRRSGRRTIRCSEKGVATPPLPSPPAVAPSILINSLGMRLALIAADRFVMGSPVDEPERSGTEDQHTVEISQPFYLGTVPVTQDQYQRIMGTDPSCFAELERAEVEGQPAKRLPVERVSWDDACDFCRRISELEAEKTAGRCYRLPTEAEWEYACRAGTTSAFAFGPSLGPAQANFDASGTTPVGSFQPNAWGLYDMHGNVWEWCEDWFSPDYYSRSPSRDPHGPATGFARVLRGGGWRSRAAQCRSAARYSATATQRHDAFGFRVACIIQ
jgi:formylglycine-generating enzyme